MSGKIEDRISDKHISVMLNRCVALLSPSIESTSNPVVVDATLGLGGHSEAILKKYSNVVVIGIDRDPEAISLATKRLAGFGTRFVAVHAVYDQLLSIISDLGYDKVNGILSLTWVFHRCKLMKTNGAFHIRKMHLWICAWTEVVAFAPLTS